MNKKKLSFLLITLKSVSSHKWYNRKLLKLFQMLTSSVRSFYSAEVFPTLKLFLTLNFLKRLEVLILKTFIFCLGWILIKTVKIILKNILMITTLLSIVIKQRASMKVSLKNIQKVKESMKKWVLFIQSKVQEDRTQEDQWLRVMTMKMILKMNIYPIKLQSMTRTKKKKSKRSKLVKIVQLVKQLNLLMMIIYQTQKEKMMNKKKLKMTWFQNK